MDDSCRTDLRSLRRKEPCGTRTPGFFPHHSSSLWGLSRPVFLSLCHLLEVISRILQEPVLALKF